MLKRDSSQQLSILLYRCPSASLRKLLRRLRAHYAVEAGAAGREEPLTPGALRGHDLVVIGGPVRAPLGNAEIAAARAFVEAGGALLCLGEGAEGGDVRGDSGKAARGNREEGSENDDHSELSLDMNELLRPYGICVNADVVVRTVFYKYLHPKEAFVSKGCVNDAFGALPIACRRSISPLLTF
jgi:intraflagellar transport protein 52